MLMAHRDGKTSSHGISVDEVVPNRCSREVAVKLQLISNHCKERTATLPDPDSFVYPVIPFL